MSVFIWTPEFGATNNPTATVIEAKFGDGYSQRQAAGMNSVSDVWTLSFNNRSPEEGAAIKAFLKARGGREAFDWTPPFETTPIKVVCRAGNWSVVTIKGGFVSVSAKFEQVFEP